MNDILLENINQQDGTVLTCFDSARVPTSTFITNVTEAQTGNHCLLNKIILLFVYSRWEASKRLRLVARIVSCLQNEFEECY